MSWLSRWFGPRRAAPQPASAAAPVGAPPVAALPPVDAAANVSVPLPWLPWLLNCGPLAAEPPGAAEQQVLRAIDRILAAPALPDELLPRAAALIPQLLAMLRQTELPVGALAQRVAKDVVLSAEVLRLASSPYYRAQGAVTDLSQAITLIGEAGLQTVIARVVLKPMFEAAPGSFSARAAGRLWEHAEVQARHAAEGARAAGLAAFDGYLAGLLHDSGWTVALRIVDRASPAPALPPGEDFAEVLALRAHRLFGQAARRWSITPGFTAFAAEAAERDLAASRHPLAQVLREAHSLAMAELSSRAPE